MANRTGSSTRQRPVLDRFWEKVNKESGRWWQGSQCWQWTAADNGRGYGHFFPRRTQPVYAHRFGYELLVGPIPDGLTVDHRCRNRRCVNPQHLRLLTQGDNCLDGSSPPALNARKTHCAQGHPLPAPALEGGRLMRRCLVCRNERQRARRHRVERDALARVLAEKQVA